MLDKDVTGWSRKIEAVNHERMMPDEALVAILPVAQMRSWRTFVLVAYSAAAHRDDLLRLKWSDVDLDGSEAERFGMPLGCPSVRIANNKRKEPRRVQLHPTTVKALRDLQDHPMALTPARYPWQAGTISEHVFPVVGYAQPGSAVSGLFALIVVRAELVDAEGGNRYGLHDIQRTTNEDTGRAGGSLRDQPVICGHKSAAVNIDHYRTESAERLRELQELIRVGSGSHDGSPKA